MLPIIYFVIVPSVLQYKIDHMPKSEHPSVLHAAGLGVLTADSLPFYFNATIGPLAAFGINAGVSAMDVHVYDDANNRLVTVTLPQIEFILNNPQIAFNATVVFDDEAQANMAKVITQFSTPEGLTDFKVTAKFNAPIRVFGIQIYAGIPLHKEIVVGNVKADGNDFMAASDPNAVAAFAFDFPLEIRQPRAASLPVLGSLGD